MLLFNKESTIDKLETWKFDVQGDIHEAKWEMECLNGQKQYKYENEVSQYKWLMRTYITPVRMNRWYPSTPDTCIKCLEGKGALYHCVWECPKSNKYWKTVVDNISGVVGVTIPHKAKLCILGIYPDNFTASPE